MLDDGILVKTISGVVIFTIFLNLRNLGNAEHLGIL